MYDCAVFSKLKAIFPRALSKLDNLKTEADAISSPFSNTFQWYITSNCFHPYNAMAFNITSKSMWDWKKKQISLVQFFISWSPFTTKTWASYVWPRVILQIWRALWYFDVLSHQNLNSATSARFQKIVLV